MADRHEPRCAFFGIDGSVPRTAGAGKHRSAIGSNDFFLQSGAAVSINLAPPIGRCASPALTHWLRDAWPRSLATGVSFDTTDSAVFQAPALCLLGQAGLLDNENLALGREAAQ